MKRKVAGWVWRDNISYEVLSIYSKLQNQKTKRNKNQLRVQAVLFKISYQCNLWKENQVLIVWSAKDYLILLQSKILVVIINR